MHMQCNTQFAMCSPCFSVFIWKILRVGYERHSLYGVAISFTAKSARQNRAFEQEDIKDETAKPNQDQKHGWQAKRSLDNELYRNVELEVWEDSKNGNVSAITILNFNNLYLS